MTTLIEIDRRLRGFATTTKNYRNNAQSLAVDIIRHAEEHGDCTRALRLCALVGPKDRAHMAAYFTAFSPIKVDVAAKKVRLSKPDAKSYNDWDVDGALATPWYEWGKAPSVPKSFNLNSFRADLQKLLKQYEKKIKKGECGDPHEIEEDIRAFKVAAADCGARHAPPVVDQVVDFPVRMTANGDIDF